MKPVSEMDRNVQIKSCLWILWFHSVLTLIIVLVCEWREHLQGLKIQSDFYLRNLFYYCWSKFCSISRKLLVKISKMCMYMYMHIYTSMYMYMHAYMYTYMYICAFAFSCHQADSRTAQMWLEFSLKWLHFEVNVSYLTVTFM